MQYYAPEASCSLNIWFITSSILMFLIYGFISISPIRHESAGLFTSACVFAYTTYYVWSALNSEPPTDACASTSAGANKAITIIGFVVAILAVSGCRVCAAVACVSSGSKCAGWWGVQCHVLSAQRGFHPPPTSLSFVLWS